jgi:hypothetical protein
MTAVVQTLPLFLLANMLSHQSGKRIDDSWICNDCATKRSDETTSIILDDDNGIHHEHIGDASKSDVSPNTLSADEANL